MVFASGAPEMKMIMRYISALEKLYFTQKVKARDVVMDASWEASIMNLVKVGC